MPPQERPSRLPYSGGSWTSGEAGQILRQPWLRSLPQRGKDGPPTTKTTELGVIQQTVGHWESGRCLPNAGYVLRLAEALDCTPFEIDIEINIPLPADLMQLVFEWPVMSPKQRRAVLGAVKAALS